MSKLSEILYERALPLWNEETENEFVSAMADGTLDEQKYCAYMLQDYCYLKDYIGILEWMYEHTDDDKLAEFLKNTADNTRNEKDTVHIPNMKRLGITDEEINNASKAPVSEEYLNYMMSKAREGIVYGITALLQCSWSYAYIARTAADRYKDKLESSPYAEWFSAYTSEEYSEANRLWIEKLDCLTKDISFDEQEKLCVIFEECAHYESCFWAMFFDANADRP